MIRRPPRSTPLYSSAASDVYKRQLQRCDSMRRGPRLLHGGCVVTVLLAGPVYRKNVGGVSGGRRGSERVSRKTMEHGPKDESGRHSPLLCHWGFPLDRCPGGYRPASQVG